MKTALSLVLVCLSLTLHATVGTWEVITKAPSNGIGYISISSDGTLFGYTISMRSFDLVEINGFWEDNGNNRFSAVYESYSPVTGTQYAQANWRFSKGKINGVISGAGERVAFVGMREVGTFNPQGIWEGPARFGSNNDWVILGIYPTELPHLFELETADGTIGFLIMGRKGKFTASMEDVYGYLYAVSGQARTRSLTGKAKVLGGPNGTFRLRR